MDLTRPAFPRLSPAASPFELTPARRAAATLAGALALGIATQALFWRSNIGLNFFLWTLLTVAACVASLRPRRVTAVGGGAITSSLLLSLAVVRYAGSWTFALAVPATLALLAVLPVALRDEADLARAARLPLEALLTMSPRRLTQAMREASRVPGVAVGGEHDSLRQVLKGLMFGLPVTGVFIALLASDADFGHLLGRVQATLGEGLSFTAWALVTAGGALVTHMAYRRPRREASDVGFASAYRAPQPADAGEEPRELAPTGRVAASTWVMVLGQVAFVFAAFVGVNLKGLFGGHALVRAPGSLTYAKYLHAGFGQLLLASVLSIFLVVLGHNLLRPRALARRGFDALVPGGRLLVGVECTLLGLTAVTVASCAQRLAIYEDAYGATRLRLGVAFVLLAVLAALAATLLKVARRGWDGYGGALASLFVGLTVVASWVNADAYIARTNLDRAERGMPLDLRYLSSLSVDAKGVLSHPVVVRDRDLQDALATAYCGDRSGVGWRAHRGIACGATR